jgi:(p)ppGpp synthase/HD superfamily hydrolase
MEDSNKVLYSILTERLELLRQLDAEGDSEKRRHIARETQNLHAPMAHRLGLYQIKTEMEDLALKFLDYDTYKYIAHALNAKKAEREAYIASFIAPLEAKLKEAGFENVKKISMTNDGSHVSGTVASSLQKPGELYDKTEKITLTVYAEAQTTETTTEKQG